MVLSKPSWLKQGLDNILVFNPWEETPLKLTVVYAALNDWKRANNHRGVIPPNRFAEWLESEYPGVFGERFSTARVQRYKRSGAWWYYGIRLRQNTCTPEQ